MDAVSFNSSTESDTLRELSGAAPTPGTTWSSGDVGEVACSVLDVQAVKQQIDSAIRNNLKEFIIVRV